jgi:hypothetical protein
VRLHIHTPPAKAHALGLKPKPLLDGRVSAEFDLTACAQYALPRQSKTAVQKPRH